MSFFKKPAVLIVLSVILLFSSTVISTRIKLGEKCAAVTDLFYEDTADQKSISSLMWEIVTQSQTMADIAGSYGLNAEELEQQTEWLNMALHYNRGSENYIFAEYSLLLKSLNSMRRQLAGAALNEHDSSLLSSAEAVIDTNQEQISSLAYSYNSAVRSFNRRYQRFPAVMMAGLSGVEFPAEFS